MTEIDPTVSRATKAVSRWIALRYLFAGQHEYARFISWISLLGVALGVAVLILVLSVMNGFDRELSARILGTVPHVLIEPVREDAVVPDRLLIPEAQAMFAFFESQGMVMRNNAVVPVAVYGLDGVDAEHLPILAQGARGQLSELLSQPRSIVMGAPLARELRLLEGDSVMLMMTRIDNGRVRPQLERFNLAGTFEIGAELDSGLVLVSLADMQTPRFAGTGRFGSRLVLHDPFTAPEVGQRLRAQLGDNFHVTDWGSTYGELFRAVKLEKSMMFLLLVLIVGIAAFNIVAGQTMQVNDKRGDIAILRTMGAGDGVILRVFLQQGFLTAIFGVALGVLLGIVLALNITEMVAAVEQLFDARLLAGTYFLEVPSQLQVVDLLGVVAITLLISGIAAFVPAYKSLAVNPITALHSA